MFMEKFRYSRLVPLQKYGGDALARLQEAHVAVVGVGALGGAIATLLATLGFGKIIPIDRDIVTIENLGTSTIFTLDDAKQKKFKAEAIAERLKRINPQVEVFPRAISLTNKNIESELEGVDVILDGLDNFRTRFLVNEVAVKLGKPYVYGGTAGLEGVVMPIAPGNGPCLRCVIPEIPKHGESPSCAEIGMDPALVQMISAVEVDIAVKLIGSPIDFEPRLYKFDAVLPQAKALPMPPRNENCPVCVRREFDHLQGVDAPKTESICGSDSVQVILNTDRLDLDRLGKTLTKNGFDVKVNPYFLRATAPNGTEYTLFPQGKVVMKGSDEPEQLEVFIASYLGV